MKPLIYTFTGRQVNPLDLQPDDICIEDIAHALALCNRFAGSTKKPISVAQHSVYVSRLMKDGLRGLLHDASEAYLGDVTKWLKADDCMRGYRAAEYRAQMAIYAKFGVAGPDTEELDWADRVMVRWEGAQGILGFAINHPRYPPLSTAEVVAVGAWGFWTWQAAERAFLDQFRLLGFPQEETGAGGEAGASRAGGGA